MGTTTAPLRAGLLGYGVAGRFFHAPFLATVPGLALAAVVTSDPERAAQARADHPGVEVLPDAGALWDRRDDLDLVVVATTNRTHVPLATAALEAGLPVVVDKPLAPTPAEGRRLVAAARSAGVPLTVFQNRRWDGDLLTLRQLIEEGALGRVLRFESRFERWRPVPRDTWRERGAPEEAGGLLYDLGTHLVDQALHLFGPVTSVYAEVDRRRPGAEVDDDVFLALAHASGVRSHLWTGSLAAQRGPRLRVLGDAAAYVKHGLDVQEDALRGGVRPGTAGWGEEPAERWGLLGVEPDLRPVPTEPGDYGGFYAALVAALREGGPVPVDPAEAVATAEVLDAARRSAHAGAVVTPGG